MADPVLTAQAVADLVGGRLLGDGATRLERIGPLDRGGPETLSFLVSTRYLAYFRTSKAGAVLLPPAFESEPEGPATRIVVADPYRSLLSVLPKFVPVPVETTGIHPSATVGTGARLGERIFIGPHVVLGRDVVVGAGSRLDASVVIGDGVQIGADCRLGPGVVCHEGTRLGARVVLKAHAVIGGPGFGFLPSRQGHQRIPHTGACIIEDDVEIGSNSTVDRGSIDDTVVGKGTKIDNLVHIAHNCRIGSDCLIMALSGVAGSSRLGNEVIIAGGGGVSDHCEIGDRVRLSARSTIIGDVPAGSTFGGYPARPHREFLRAQAALNRLSPLVKELEILAHERKHRGQTND
ncbi:MAG: UDP-3-O-(3-hydroxymyristoyl)glucosamine N-acyltransferase [Gemmatimonadota bacterium]